MQEIEAALKRCAQSLITLDQPDAARETLQAWEMVRHTNTKSKLINERLNAERHGR